MRVIRSLYHVITCIIMWCETVDPAGTNHARRAHVYSPIYTIIIITEFLILFFYNEIFDFCSQLVPIYVFVRQWSILARYSRSKIRSSETTIRSVTNGFGRESILYDDGDFTYTRNKRRIGDCRIRWDCRLML